PARPPRGRPRGGRRLHRVHRTPHPPGHRAPRGGSRQTGHHRESGDDVGDPPAIRRGDQLDGRAGEPLPATAGPAAGPRGAPMTVVEEVVMPRNTGRAFVVRTGEGLRIYAESIVDVVVFNHANRRERFDQARTKANQAKLFLTTVDVLYSKFNRVMMTIVEDTFRGRHDLQYGFCSFGPIASNGVEGRPSYEVF